MYSSALRKVAAPLWTNIIHQHSCHLQPAPLWLAHWHFVLCVVDRNGALDLQVQSRGHGGLFTADLWPWPERTYRRRQVTHIQHCYFSHSLSFVLCLCCLCFCCLSFLFFCSVCWCVAWVMISFSIDVFKRKMALEIVSKSIVFVEHSQVCVCLHICVLVLLMLWGHKSVYTVTSWGLASLLETNTKCPKHKSLHLRMKAWLKVRVRSKIRISN